MAYIHHNYGRGTTANDYARVDSKRAKVKRDCWVCGADAQGKFCGPCSADVYDARTAWKHQQDRLAKKKKKT